MPNSSSLDQALAKEDKLNNYVVLSSSGQIGLYSNSRNCRDLSFVGRVTGSTSDAAMKLLSVLRVYALFGQKRPLLILLCPFIIADVVGGFLIWFSAPTINTQGTYLEPFAPCLSSGGGFETEISPGQPSPSYYIVAVISPFLQLTFDTTIFILILVKTAGHLMQSRKAGIHSIAEVVLCDGRLLTWNIVNRHSVLLASIFPGTMSNTWLEFEDIIDPFLSVLANILIIHFVLNLRAFSNRTIQHSSEGPSNAIAPPLSTLDFAENRFLGNIGAPLDYNQWDNVDEIETEVKRGVYMSVADIELEIPDNTVDPLNTLVPVIYDDEKGPIRFVPMQKEAGPNYYPNHFFFNEQFSVVVKP
ncbi:hypothetical protein BDP27DRAFT_1365829 [Rhodocollybia butyracea]|uniref:Uncharacterized protein n=1 Tax=Rhodocollybia butyracea TaxID=206335 RepID=A0A9P5PIS7_9AGAR|nr:hypothetical protein BDP27DRAFT_1365829 [Rhodocollybia butyracea]